MLTTEERKQYSRHLILDQIGEAGQEKLRQARVLVIGAGGLGCPILQYLAAAGVGTLGIIDHDTVDQSNLQRQVLYTHDDLGQPKAATAARKLGRLNPYIRFEVFPERLTRANALEHFAAYDIIVDGSDNFPTRYLVNDAAVLTGKPLVFGAIFKFEGQVSVFNYADGPTYRCLYPTPPRPGAVPNCADIGVLGILPGVIGALQASEVVKIICGIGTPLSGKLLTYDVLSHRQLLLSFGKTSAAGVTALEEDYAFFCGLTPGVPTVEISSEALAAQREEYHLLDVRSPRERAAHSLGGLHIPLPEIPARFREIPTDKPVVVYCKSGVRSQRAIQLLREQKFTGQLLNLKGGIS